MTAAFVHLNLHTEYSLVDSVVRIKPLIKRLTKLQMPAVAVTDQCNLFALVKFYSQAQAAGIKPIVGAEFKLKAADRQTPARLLLLCINNEGYRNLARLVSRCYLHGQEAGEPRLDPDWLGGATDGLIALSGGMHGEIARVAASAAAEAQLADTIDRYKKLFPNRFYLEVQRTNRSGEEEWIAAALQLAQQHRLPLVATNGVRFLSGDEFDAHEARVCINQGRVLDDPRRPRDYSDQCYLRSAAEMAEEQAEGGPVNEQADDTAGEEKAEG